MKERAEILQAAWKKAKQNPQNIAWKKVHEATVARWRKEGDEVTKPNYSTPAGFDLLCKRISQLPSKP